MGKKRNILSSSWKDFYPLLPTSFVNVLEMGFGYAINIKWLKGESHCKSTFGLGLILEKAIEIDKNLVNEIVVGDAKEFILIVWF